jgi:hypothetical protein
VNLRVLRGYFHPNVGERRAFMENSPDCLIDH